MDSPDFPVANRGVLSGIPAQLELIKGKKRFYATVFPLRRQSAPIRFAHIEIKNEI